MLKHSVTIINKLGLHARAAAKFVQIASHYAAEITVTAKGRTINGKSIMGVMMLAASQGTVIELAISGEDQEQAFAALSELITNRFGEEE